MVEQDFIKAGFTVVGTETSENKLLSFLKENYPNIIRDTEINLEELKTVLGLPIDEKVNGYGLNFVGRNFARAKYAQKTEKELLLNTPLSKDIDTTENLVLKGDNLESLKILKSYYSGQIKCIYIDPPYNTDKEEFVYPDRFDKEEAEVLGLANLSESDFERMEFSFKSKKNHNGWLAFMYPRLLLARDLLRKDGVIFISIDDNEQANLKLLCDEIFQEENFEGHIHWRRRHNQPNDKTKMIGLVAEHILSYSKNKEEYKKQGVGKVDLTGDFSNPDNDKRGDWASKPWKVGSDQSGSRYNTLPRSTNPADWGTFGDYIGGILNPIISLLTLIVTIVIAINISRIERRNHEETVHNPVKPFFVIGDGYFYSSDISAIGPTVEKDYYDYNEPQEPAGQSDYLNKHFYLKVSNKGLGVATDVIATFEIDLKELAKSLQIDDPRIKTTVSEIRTDEDGRDFIVLTIDAEEHFHYKSFFSKILAKERLGLGVIEKDKETSAVVPSQMMAAFQLQNLIRRFKDGDIVFPTLFVTFDYKNIYGREMSTKFRIGLVHVHDYGSYTVYRLLQEQV